MSNELNVETILIFYNQLLNIKTENQKTKYPFISMDGEKITHTLKKIDLTYQHLKKAYTGRRFRGGGETSQEKKEKKILIFTL
jgi:hypothetical protein